MQGVPIPNNFSVLAPKPLDARQGKFLGGVTLPFATLAEAFADIGPDIRTGPGLLVPIGTETAYHYHRFVRAVPGTDQGWDLVPLTIAAQYIVESAQKRFVSDAEMNAIVQAITNIENSLTTDFIKNQLAAVQTGNFWVSGKAILGAGVDNGAQLQVKGQAVIDGNTHIDGKGIIGTGGVDNGAIFQVKGGAASLAVNAADFPVLDGALMYRSDLAKFRAASGGVWKNLATEDQIPAATPPVLSGLTIYVDSNSLNSTDTRTGLNKYSLTNPFRTIQAASDASAQGDRIYVHSGTYTENVVAASGYLNLILGPLVLIQGTVQAHNQLFIRGDYPIHPQDQFAGNEFSEPLFQGFSKIVSNSATPTVYVPPSNILQSLVTGVHVENTGSGDAIAVARGMSVENCRALSAGGVAINFGGERTGRVNNSFAKSTGNIAINNAHQATNCVAISLGPAGSSFAIRATIVENCKAYSANDMAFGYALIIRNCFINCWNEVTSAATNSGAGVHVEIVNNIINVRNPAVVNAFYILFQNDVTDAAYIANNQMNKNQFSVSLNLQSGLIPNIEVNNVFGLPFPATTPRIGGGFQPV